MRELMQELMQVTPAHFIFLKTRNRLPQVTDTDPVTPGLKEPLPQAGFLSHVELVQRNRVK